MLHTARFAAALTGLVAAASAAGEGRVAPPPAEIAERFALAPSQTQCLLVEGTPFVASSAVSPFALLEAEFLARAMVGDRVDLLRALGAARVRFVAMGVREMTCDVPDHADLFPPAYWNKRARGLGATTRRPAVSAGEENLLGLEGDPYATESIFVHEFAHALHEISLASVDPRFDARLREVFDAAMAKGLWKGTYAASNPSEYWAEGAQSWFDTNRENDAQHGSVDTRDEVRAHDPALATLLEEVFGGRPWRYVNPRARPQPGHLAGFDRSKAPRFDWPAEVTMAFARQEALERATERRDGEEELAWLRRGAEAGIASSQAALGLRHRDGRGVPQDDATAVRWFRRAAALGDPDSLDHLGWMTREGRGTERDDAEAVALFVRAASMGHPQAMANLAAMLDAGRGVAQLDPDEALRWLRRAAIRGHAGARARLGNAW